MDRQAEVEPESLPVGRNHCPLMNEEGVRCLGWFSVIEYAPGRFTALPNSNGCLRRPAVEEPDYPEYAPRRLVITITPYEEYL